MPPGSAMENLLNPRSIVVVGGSADSTKAGGKPIAYMARLGFRGRVTVVNPSRPRIPGVACHADVGEIPYVPDLAVIALASGRVEASLRACAAKGIRAAVIFASGYAETGDDGAVAEENLRAVARAEGLTLCGPNCLGVVNFHTGAAATFTSALEVDNHRQRPGGVALVSQSGAVGAVLLVSAGQRLIGVSHFVSTGNQAGVTVSDVVRHLASDDSVSVVACYLEGVSPGPFAAAAEAIAAAGKQLVVMKGGASDAGAQSAATHTGSLVGDDAAFDALLQRHHIPRAKSMGELLDLAAVMSGPRILSGGALGVISLSGGAAILLADQAHDNGLSLPEFGQETLRELNRVLPDFATPRNPLDVTGRPVWEAGMMGAAVRTVSADHRVQTVVVYIGYSPGDVGVRIAREIAEAAAVSSKPTIVCWVTGENVAAQTIMREAGISIVADSAAAVVAIAAIERSHGVTKRRGAGQPTRDDSGGQASFNSVDSSRHVVVPEPEVKSLLRTRGLSIPRGVIIAASADTSELSVPYPVIVKLISPDVTHRSAIGAIQSNVIDASGLSFAMARISEVTRQQAPAARIDGFLAEEIVEDGLDLFVSVQRKGEYGTLATLGLGGVLVEAYDRTSSRLLPVTRREMVAMLTDIGLPEEAIRSYDVESALSAVMSIAELAESDTDIDTIEINPLRVTRSRAVVLDALMTLSPDPAGRGATSPIGTSDG